MRTMTLRARRRTRRLAVVAAFAVGVLALAACSSGGSSSNSSDSGGSTTITVWSWSPNAKKIAALFEKSHPKIQVKLINQGDGTTQYKHLQTAFQAGSGAPDVAMVEYAMIPQYALSGYLAPLNDLGADKVKSDFTDASINQTMVNGKIYGIPLDVAPMAFAYRKDLLAAAGITTPPKTWAEFAEDAAKYHAANPKSYLINSPFSDATFQEMLWQAGVFPIGIDGKKLSIDFDSDAALKVLQYWQGLQSKGLIADIPVFSPDWNKAVGDGTIAGQLAAAWSEVLLRPAAKNSSGKWQVAPLPTWTAGEAASAEWGGSSYTVTAQSKNKKAAAEYAIWINHDPDAYKLLFKLDASFPVLKSFANDKEFMGTPDKFYGGQPANQVFADALKTVPNGWQWSPFTSTVTTALKDNFAPMEKGSLSPKQVLQNVQKKLTDFATSQGFSLKK